MTDKAKRKTISTRRTNIQIRQDAKHRIRLIAVENELSIRDAASALIDFALREYDEGNMRIRPATGARIEPPQAPTSFGR